MRSQGIGKCIGKTVSDGTQIEKITEVLKHKISPPAKACEQRPGQVRTAQKAPSTVGQGKAFINALHLQHCMTSQNTSCVQQLRPPTLAVCAGIVGSNIHHRDSDVIIKQLSVNQM